MVQKNPKFKYEAESEDLLYLELGQIETVKSQAVCVVLSRYFL